MDALKGLALDRISSKLPLRIVLRAVALVRHRLAQDLGHGTIDNRSLPAEAGIDLRLANVLALRLRIAK